MKERSPPISFQLRRKQNNILWLLPQKKCLVKVFTICGYKFSTVVVNSQKAVDDIQRIAIKRTQPNNRDNLYTPGVKVISNRPQGSPGDAFTKVN